MARRVSLDGKRVLITGGARGIGLAAARAAVDRGARVALLDRDEAAVKAAARELGSAAMGLTADVTDADGLVTAVDTAAAKLGGLDLVIANAGVAPKMTTVAGTSHAEFARVIGINLTGVWYTVHAALPHLAASGGRLVLVASVYSFINGAFSGPYAVSKAGVEALARTLRVELAADGIAVTAAHFGFVDTDLVHGSLDGDPLAERLEAMWPNALTRRLQPDAAARLLLQAVEGGKARIVAPGVWRPLDRLRGVLGPSGDGALARLPRFQRLVAETRAREIGIGEPPVSGDDVRRRSRER